MSELPQEMTYGYVSGRFMLEEQDHDDEDQLPQAVPATWLRIALIPLEPIRHLAAPGLDPPMTTVQVPTYRGYVGPDGLLRERPSYEDAPGLVVPIGGYSVMYSGSGGTRHELPLNHDIEVSAEHTLENPLDLSSAGPYVPPEGTDVTVLQVAGTPFHGAAVSWDSSQGVLRYVNLDHRVSSAVASMLVAGPNVSINYDEENHLLTISSSGSGGGGGTVGLEEHIASPTPHPAYDVNIPRLDLLFENGLI